jgi:hypothetical protein
MAEQQKEQRSVPPYLPYKTFINFIDGLKFGGVPSRIDKGLTRTMSGGQRSSLFKALQYLNLMNAERRPTDLLNRLVHSEGAERQEALRDTLLGAYRFLDGEIDLHRATEDELREVFEKKGGAGGDTVRKAVAFYLAAAKAGELPLSQYLTNARATRSPGRQRRAKTAAKGSSVKQRENGEVDEPPAQPWAQMLLAKFPSFDPAWPDEVKASWFQAFQQLMTMQEDDEGGEA